MDFFSVNGTDSDAQAVYEHDIHHCVAFCHAMIGECSFPSTGLGWELGTAIEKRKIPTLLLAEDGEKVTRLVIGSARTVRSKPNPKVQFQRYHNEGRMLQLCLGFIDEQKDVFFYTRCVLIDVSFFFHKLKQSISQRISNLKKDMELTNRMR